MKKLSKELPLSILIAEDNFINQKLLLDDANNEGHFVRGDPTTW